MEGRAGPFVRLELQERETSYLLALDRDYAQNYAQEAKNCVLRSFSARLKTRPFAATSRGVSDGTRTRDRLDHKHTQNTPEFGSGKPNLA
jgi:hypothetical protein